MLFACRTGTNQISFWDPIAVDSAIQLGCQAIWSEDLNSGNELPTTSLSSVESRPASFPGRGLPTHSTVWR
jgi:predicted nucleic acid-binding protein